MIQDCSAQVDNKTKTENIFVQILPHNKRVTTKEQLASYDVVTRH